MVNDDIFNVAEILKMLNLRYITYVMILGYRYNISDLTLDIAAYLQSL